MSERSVTKMRVELAEARRDYTELVEAARKVIKNWATGDLGRAVNGLEAALPESED